MSIAADEAGPDVSPFTSKFDYAIAHPDQQVLTAGEIAWELFDGRGNAIPGRSWQSYCLPEGHSRSDAGPSTGDGVIVYRFAAFNLGLPKNDDIPSWYENEPDKYGVTPNPQGTYYIDNGLGDFLRNAPGTGAINPNNDWMKFAAQNDEISNCNDAGC